MNYFVLYRQFVNLGSAFYRDLMDQLIQLTKTPQFGRRSLRAPGSELGISGLCPAVMPVILGISPTLEYIRRRNKNSW